MGKLNFFKITLRKTIPIYSPGEAIEGTVSLNIIERLKIS